MYGDNYLTCHIEKTSATKEETNLAPRNEQSRTKLWLFSASFQIIHALNMAMGINDFRTSRK